MSEHIATYIGLLVSGFIVGYGTFAAIHGAAIAKVRSELARIQPILAKALEGQKLFEEAHSKTERVHDELLHQKWTGRKSGIIT